MTALPPNGAAELPRRSSAGRASAKARSVACWEHFAHIGSGLISIAARTRQAFSRAVLTFLLSCATSFAQSSVFLLTVRSFLGRYLRFMRENPPLREEKRSHSVIISASVAVVGRKRQGSATFGPKVGRKFRFAVGNLSEP